MTHDPTQAPLDCPATAIAGAIGERKISAVEIARAFLARVDAVNPHLNAVCSLNERALEEARACDDHLAARGAPRPLEGVPFVIKDNIETAGLRTTYGSRLHEHNVPDEDAVLVTRLRAAGGVLLGKTNTPEFAADPNTTNAVFGQTRNPWDLNVTPGGSSGGTGSAIAAGLVPIGIGTDLGGSIRIPSAFNGIVGIRPVPGRVPVYPQEYGWDTLIAHVQGPMARWVSDLGLVLSVIAGPDERDPSTLPAAGVDFAAVAQPITGARIAYAGDLGGLVPLDPEVARLAESAARSFEALGCMVESDTFDASDLPDIVAGTRGYNIIARLTRHYQAHPELLTPPIISQVRSAQAVDVAKVAESERLRTAYWHRVRVFLERYDFILTPTVGAPPFRLDGPLPSEIGGKKVGHYFDCIRSTYAFSVLGLPAMSVPCGMTRSGLPVGLQIVGPRQREDRVLALGAAFCAASGDEGMRVHDIDPGTIRPVSEALVSPGVPVR